MKLVRRDKDINPLKTIPIWGYPLIGYIFTIGLELFYPEREWFNHDREWIFWVVIPTLFIMWVMMHWEIVKTKNNHDLK
jgi:hypothetical protein